MLLTPRKPSVLFFAKDPHNVAVYERVLRRLLAENRVRLYLTAKTGREGFDSSAVFGDFLRGGARLISYRLARLMKFSLYLSPDMYLLARRSRVTVHTFHGISIKGKGFSEKALAFDALFLIGPYQRRRFAELGVTSADDPRFREIGMPKTDAFFDGSLDRAAYLRRFGLEPERPTVLYAPTWRPESSLNKLGEPLIRAMRSQPWNFLVKLHDLSYELKPGLPDWRAKLRELEGGNVAIVRDADVTPALHAADLLISDASSVANEFTLLDRPLVFIDVPELFEKYSATIDREGWGQSTGPVARDVPEAIEHIAAQLADASGFAEARRRVAHEAFYNPGRATEAAVREIYRLTSIET